MKGIPLYLFRGTTRGYGGSIYPRTELSSTTTDPAVATVFGTTLRRLGEPVVQLFRTDCFVDRVRDNRGSGKLAATESEFTLAVSPGEIAARSVEIDAFASLESLKKMGIRFPANIYNLADLDPGVRLTGRLNDEQILEFVRTFGGGKL